MASLINEQTQYQDASGNAIVNGFIHIGVQNLDPTLVGNKITIYSDRDLTIVISNPQLTDSTGKSINKIWIPGKYAIVVQDAGGAQRCSDLDAGESPATGITNLTNIAGANTITADASPTIAVLVDKEIYPFTAIGANTGAVTLAIDLVAAKPVLKYHDQALVADDLEINQVVAVMYNSTDDIFELQSNVDPNKEATATNHTKAGNVQLRNGTDETITSISISNDVTVSTFETIGPTSSGATNIWTGMDRMPANATIMLARVSLSISPSGTGQAAAIFYAAGGDVTTPVIDPEVTELASLKLDVDAAITGQTIATFDIMIPVDPATQIFKATWAEVLSSATSVVLEYRGFITDT